MIHIGICDDDTSDLSNLNSLISSYNLDKYQEISCTAFDNPFILIDALKEGLSMDILFLDILMPQMTGIAVAKEIRTFNKNLKIVFLTSSSEFAIDSYAVYATNYVLKPISKEKLFFTLDDIIEKLDAREDTTLLIKTTEGIVKIALSQLMYCEVNSRNVLYYLSTGKVIHCSSTFALASNKLLSYPCFLKPHRSYVVNMNYINTFSTNEITIQNKNTVTRIPVSRRKYNELLDEYMSFYAEGN